MSDVDERSAPPDFTVIDFGGTLAYLRCAMQLLKSADSSDFLKIFWSKHYISEAETLLESVLARQSEEVRRRVYEVEHSMANSTKKPPAPTA